MLLLLSYSSLELFPFFSLCCASKTCLGRKSSTKEYKSDFTNLSSAARPSFFSHFVSLLCKGLQRLILMVLSKNNLTSKAKVVHYDVEMWIQALYLCN